MKKLGCVVLFVIMGLSIISGAMAEAVNPASQTAVDEPDVKWNYEVPLRVIKGDYTYLVNGEILLSEEHVPEPLVKMTSVKRATSAQVYLQETAAKALKEMFDAAKAVTEYTYTTAEGEEVTVEYEDGMTLYLKSGYRSYGTQATTYSNYLARNNGKDLGFVAKPGTSEHQTGLSADILSKKYASRPTMTQDFEFEPEAIWMKENCASFGFILRYPKDKKAEEITGIFFEPWHFRYVGVDAAGYIMKTGMTLEEFQDDAEFALAEFLGAGGDEQAQIAFEISKLNSPPDSFILEEKGSDGDSEISLVFY